MRSMVHVVDDGIANITKALHAKQMWDTTLIIFSADNGGGAGGGQPSNNCESPAGPLPRTQQASKAYRFDRSDRFD